MVISICRRCITARVDSVMFAYFLFGVGCYFVVVCFGVRCLRAALVCFALVGSFRFTFFAGFSFFAFISVAIFTCYGSGSVMICFVEAGSFEDYACWEKYCGCFRHIRGRLLMSRRSFFARFQICGCIPGRDIHMLAYSCYL
jgi:hypothetical protein